VSSDDEDSSQSSTSSISSSNSSSSSTFNNIISSTCTSIVKCQQQQQPQQQQQQLQLNNTSMTPQAQIDSVELCEQSNEVAASSSQRDDIDPDTFIYDNLTFTWRCLFEQPGISPDFYTKLNEKKVSLESIYSNHFKLNGIVRVINLAFVKNVFIRYTINNWSTFNDTDCTYLAHGTNDEKLTDRFLFTVLLDKNSIISSLNDNNNKTNKLPLLKLEFAICYQVSFKNQSDPNLSATAAIAADANKNSNPTMISYDQSYWDNNFSNNYQYDCYFKIN
jgi:hypothetical protein